MGLDIGEKRTGVALSDELGITAQPMDTIEAKGPDDMEKKVLDLIKRLNPDRIVMGLPRNMDGSIGPRAQAILSLAERVREKSGHPVETWDERLTTIEAERVLLSAQMGRKKRKKTLDTLSAVLILQGYLDSLRASPDAGPRSES